jgi:hypothetical protein
MGRDRNTIPTATITLSTTPQVIVHLKALMRSGLWGKTPSEAAERLVADQIRQLVQNGTLKRRGRQKL